MRQKKRLEKRFYIIAIALFWAIAVPVLTVRGCQANQNRSQEPNVSAEKKSNGESVSQELIPESFDISVYDEATSSVFTISIEEYLVGVVAAEMPASYETEALKAQAIAARTYTAKKLAEFGGAGCDNDPSGHAAVCTSSAHCQAYRNAQQRSAAWGNNAPAYEVKIRQAVAATFGQLVVYDDAPIEAVFHSTAGGATEDSENVFSEPLPYLRSVQSDEVSAPRYASTVSISREEFVKTVNSAFPSAKLKANSLQKNIKVDSRYKSGRIQTLTLGKTKLSGKQLRALFSLDSTNVSFEFDGKNIIMHIKGYGHGVGMSQTGANDMALEGANYEDILTYYYTGTKIEKRW